ncbi:MAG: hypothetical protein ACLUFM_01500 [Lachnospiraceae bacterium]
MFSRFTKRITLLKQGGRNRAAGAETGCFRESQRITLLKQRNSRRNRAAGAEARVFRDSQNELRCKNNGIGEKPRGVRGVLTGAAEKWGWRRHVGAQNRRMAVEISGHLRKRTRAAGGQQMESCAGGGTLSKKCAKNANWTGAAALSPRRRGYAAKIMRRKNARRKFGKRASGESHYRNPCGIIRNIWYTAMRR